MENLFVDKEHLSDYIFFRDDIVGMRSPGLKKTSNLSRISYLDFVQKIREMSSDDGIAFLYDFDNEINWRELLAKIYGWAARQVIKDVGEPYYHALTEYIRRVLEKRFSPEVFKPVKDERGEYYLGEHFPRRDPLLHLETIFFIGKKLLHFRTCESSDIKVGDKIAQILTNKLNRETTFNNVLNAWEISARFHDVGRVQSYRDINDTLTDETGICKHLSTAIDSVRKNAKRDYNHGKFTATFLYDTYWKELADSEIQNDFALALDAIAIHDDLFQLIERSGMATEDVWNDDPLALFLVLVILIVELGVRICWQHPSGNDSLLGNWKAWNEVTGSIPITQVNICPREESKNVISYSNEYMDGNNFSNIGNPLADPSINFIRTMFGNKCLSLVEDNYHDFNVLWKPPTEKGYRKWFSAYSNLIHDLYIFLGNASKLKGEGWYIELKEALKTTSLIINNIDFSTLSGNEIEELKSDCLKNAKNLYNEIGIPMTIKNNFEELNQLKKWIKIFGN